MGYINPDGSELCGGLLPSGLGQSLSFDQFGNLKTTPGGGLSLALVNAVNATSAQPTPNQSNTAGARGIKVVTNVITAGTGSLTVGIQLIDPFGNPVTMLATAALTANGIYVLTIYPAQPNVPNQSLNDVLPPTWRINPVQNNSNPMTYTIGAMTLL